MWTIDACIHVKIHRCISLNRNKRCMSSLPRAKAVIHVSCKRPPAGKIICLLV